MKFLGLTHKGIEDISAQELKEKISVESEIISGGILFDLDDIKKALDFCYLSQSLKKVILLKSIGGSENIEEMIKTANDADFSDFAKKESFCLRCEAENKQEIEREVGGAIKEKYNWNVDLETPEVEIFAYITDKIYLGVDLSGFDMSKRDHNVFSVQKSIKGDIAYALTRLSGFKPGNVFLDPLCGSGALIIESALLDSKKPPHFYAKEKFSFTKHFKYDFEEIDSKIKKGNSKIIAYDPLMMHITSSKKNSKIAGVNDSIKFSRVDVDWIDLKIEEVDNIAMISPSMHNKNDEKKIEELLKQIKKILKQKCCFSFTDPRFKEKVISSGLKIIEKRKIYAGKSAMDIVVVE